MKRNKKSVESRAHIFRAIRRILSVGVDDRSHVLQRAGSFDCFSVERLTKDRYYHNHDETQIVMMNPSIEGYKMQRRHEDSLASCRRLLTRSALTSHRASSANVFRYAYLRRGLRAIAVCFGAGSPIFCASVRSLRDFGSSRPMLSAGIQTWERKY